jgi:cyclophilin family peptidyl-prolyl cis-trans isomerase
VAQTQTILVSSSLWGHQNGMLQNRNITRLDKKSIAFGEVVDGLDIIQQIETYGTPQGAPTRKVLVAQSG